MGAVVQQICSGGSSLFFSSSVRPFASKTALNEVLQKGLRAFESLLQKEGLVRSRSYALALLLCGKKRMRALNACFRGKDSPTDVLSFPSFEKLYRWTKLPDYLKRQLYLGDLVICQDILLHQAREENILPMEEFSRLFGHGLLHLLDLDHERSKREAQRMRALEARLIKGMLAP